MSSRINKIIFSIITLIFASNVYGNVNVQINKPTTHSGRVAISLNGTWQIAEGGMDKIPAKFDREVVVPGLVDMAKPSFKEPLTKSC